MKEREYDILKLVSSKNGISSKEIMEFFNISKRTLYYDINNINYNVKNYGEIKYINHEYVFSGDIAALSTVKPNKRTISSENRMYFIAYLILENVFNTIDSVANRLDVSKNTIVNTVNDLRLYLQEIGLELIFCKKYEIVGDERNIRDLYIMLTEYNFDDMFTYDYRAIKYNDKNNLELTDYSLNNLSLFVRFVEARITTKHEISKIEIDLPQNLMDKYSNVSDLFSVDLSHEEKLYIISYVSTLSNLALDDMSESIIDEDIHKIIEKVEVLTNIVIVDKPNFIINLRRHLLASYYRIKYRFPIYNPLLDQIKMDYASLFKIIKNVLTDDLDLLNFANIRDEEVAYITAYFGGYIKGTEDFNVKETKIIVICPNGLIFSKILKMQLNKYFPNINIVSVMSVYDLNCKKVDYDYIISTINLEDYSNVIVVSPLLQPIDIKNITSIFYDTSIKTIEYNINDVLEIIDNNCDIRNRFNLKKQLNKLLFNEEIKEDDRPMLKELLTRNKICKVKHVQDYHEAIELASKPLLDDGSIEKEYVTEIFKALDKFGPYIVLADKFALPHATNKVGVHKIGMSLLVVEDSVDLLGKPVNIFCVLSTLDNSSHLKALASLSEMFYDKER